MTSVEDPEKFLEVFSSFFEVKVLRLNGEPMEFHLPLDAKISDLPPGSTDISPPGSTW